MPVRETPEIARGTAADADAVAALHVASWRSAYRGILPDAYLDGALAEDLQRHWARRTARRGDDDLLLLARRSGRLLGFIAVWPDPKAPACAFIDNLHVDPALRGGGIGRRLLGHAAARLARSGYARAYLWVYEDNRRAIRFYERLGGVTEKRGREPVFGHLVDERQIAWTDLAALAAACDDPRG